MWLYLWLPMLSDGDIDYNRLSLTSTLYLCYFFSALSIRRNHICCDEFEKNSIKTVNARVLAGQTISLSGTYYRIRLAVVFRMLESLLGLYDCLGGNEAIVVRSTSMMLPAFVAWLPRLSLSSSVIPIRNVDVLPRSPMLCPLLFLAWSRVVACLVVVHVPRGCTRIIATVHIPLFPSLDERCGHVSSSWLSSPCSSIYTVTSVLTQRELDLFCSTYNIPAELRPELPDRNSTIKNNPEGKIGMYTRFIEFANYRIPLSKFLLCILEYYQINLSQLSVIGAAKVSHFEIMCRAFGRIPTVGTFRRFYVNSYSNGWLSFSKRGGAGDPCCVSKKFDSLKNWNNHFFWIDASVCPLSLPWFDGTSVVKDPLPMDEAVDLPCAELLNENRTLIRKYPETFLCLVGLSRSFVEMDVRPTLLHGDNEEMGLLDFVKTLRIPFKVKGCRQLSKLVLVLDASHDNVRTRSAPGRFVVISSESTDADVSASPQVVPPVTLDSAGATVPVAAPTGGDHPASGSGPEAGTLSATPSQGSSADDFYESQTIDSAAAQNIYVPNWNVINNDRLASPVTCRNLLDHVTPPAYWAALRNQHDAMFLDALNGKFEEEFSESSPLIQQRDARDVDLICSVVAVKVGELANLHTENVSLSERVSALELEHDGLKDQVVGEGKMREEFLSQQDAAEQHFKERATELDARIADVHHDMDNDLYPHMLTAIAGRRPLTQIEAYDPKVEGKYVEAVSEFEDLSFSMLDELEGLKDAPLASIMSALTLKDSEGDKDISSKLSRIRRSAKRRGLCPPSSIAPGEASVSAPSHDTSLTIADYQVSTLVMSGNGASVDQSPVVEPHDDLFDVSVLAEPSGV
ncbi:hypothetical protein Tco_0918455 [Tanacetum coccineum]